MARCPIHESIPRAMTDEGVEGYRTAKYHILTVVPLANGPVMKSYTMTQDEMTEFLSGYSEYAEFVVEVLRLL